PDAVRDGETGVLVDPATAEEAALVTAGLLDDPAGARALGEGGRRAVERFYNWDRVARDLRRLGDEVIAARQAPAR
ncbi:MAG TPA: hypothetical protein VFI13_09225, partial [Gemmatimonadales bacterium]|nr:hypothetical protein [Gemmatimonadales bacterium]